MVKDNKAEILDIIKRDGPLIPAQLAKVINTNILFASAILSNLVDKKEVQISSLKKGGSPFYYLKGQEDKLENFSEYLSGKEKEAFLLLKEKGVIRDKSAEPWQRVALRALKDFAIPLNVGISGEYEIFWKYYLEDNEKTKELIKNELGVSEKKKEEKEAPKKEPEKIIEEVKEAPQKEEKIRTEEKGIFEELNKYFDEKEIYIISQDVVRKNKEFNFVVDVPTSLGKLRYFVKAKTKKVINDNDITLAWEEGNENKLPVLFFTNGNLTKKAEKLLNDNVSGQFIFKKFKY
ncbi:hypothetical protein HOG16_01110 [Candidatus Woesearchaeota archaeon]|jgi:hypothetical protein|nr:hypothetical protein [Candidatus Woesearchaeota archaeon]MBT4322172.1 hypothetical protein [Candidatus Woesearchaeota archaeon]MBT4630920.1 hypothetical protein [Candidatus Woesearchaeota archaeon]